MNMPDGKSLMEKLLESARWVPSIPSGKVQAAYLAASKYDPYQRVSQLVDWEFHAGTLILL